jgi:ATP-dependent helicase/nuclease subunit A
MNGSLADEAQRRAAAVDGSVWVAASAGSGKTKVLTDRVLSLLLAGSAPTRILCLTFTRAAAAEMANRLHGQLKNWAVVGDGMLAQDLQRLLDRAPDAASIARARTLFARVLDAPGGMKIETIHAFCQSLLRRFPIEAGVAPHFEVMDERNAAEALVHARDRMLVEARLGAEPALGKALAAATELAGETVFDELMQMLLAERARLARALGQGLPAFRATLCRLLALGPDETPDGIVATACADGSFDRSQLQRAVDALLKSPNVSDVERGRCISVWLNNPAERAQRFESYAQAYLTQEGQRRSRLATKGSDPSGASGAGKGKRSGRSRHSSLPNLWNPPNPGRDPVVVQALEAEADRIWRTWQRCSAASLLVATQHLAVLGERVFALYRRYKDERALLDYDDLVLMARDLLYGDGVPPWVLFKLDGGLDHILIDEAQDTNPEQWEVVQKLADEFFVGRSARRRKRTVFAVGDTKQSIFSFQRADPAAFARMHDHFRGRAADAREGFARVPLDVSFRSTDAVLAAVDAVFAQGSARQGVSFAGEPIHHHPHRQGQSGLVELWPLVDPPDPPDAEPWQPPVEQRRAREAELRLAQAIAATIKGWIERGERLPARDRRIAAGDVMVLVRRRTRFVPALVRALKDLRIAVAGSDRMHLVEQLAVEDMMALLDFLLLPDDSLTLAAVLKGPLCGLGEDRLFELAHDRGKGVALWTTLRRRAGENEDFSRAYALLADLLGRADFAPPYELIAEILGARGGRRSFLARLGPDAADPLDEFLAAALAFERRHEPSLQGFLQWLRAGDIEVKRDLDQRGRAEVRILTVHGAKGLEAPIVFLPDTAQVPAKQQHLFWTDDGLPLWAAGGCSAPVLEAARAAAARLRDEEYRRLLYVAMTRAADRLYVCGWRTRNATPQGTWHELVAAGLGNLPGVERFRFEAPIADGWSGEGLRLVTPQADKPHDDGAKAPMPDLAALPDWATELPPPEPIPSRPLAPSRPEGVEPAPRSPLGADRGAAFRRGLLLHRLLQTLPLVAPDARAAAARRFLARPVHGLSPAEREALVAETMSVLAHPEFAPLFAPDALSEVPVTAVIGGRTVAGRIDRLLVREDDVLIVDYKTLRPVPARAADIPPLYVEQLRAYRAAVAQIYPGRRIRAALLWTDGPTLMEVPLH